MATECKRSVLSCWRCRRRKIKCDRRLPSCSQCVAARTSCTGFASADGTDGLPRSIVHQLELDIAGLETELAQSGHGDIIQASDALLQMPLADATTPVRVESGSDAIRHTIAAGSELHAMIMATAPSTSALNDLVSRVWTGLTPSSANGRKRSNTVTTTTAVLASLPNHLVHSLVRKFMDSILPQYPFLSERTVSQQLDAVLHAVQPQQNDALGISATDHDYLTVYLVLAIAVTLGSSKGGHEGRCMAFSTSLFEEGIQRFFNMDCHPSDLAAMQNTLLILIYAQINPRAGNVWILSGACMRSCLELGLHRDFSAIRAAGPEAAALSRDVFWSAYCMDRAICGALHRPLSIPDAAIDTPLPVIEEKPSAPFSHAAFLRWIQLHQLQSAMIQVHFQAAPLPDGMAWDEWLSSMEARLRAWHSRWRAASPSTPGIMDECDTADDFALSRGLACLHRPSPRMPVPSQHSLLVAFTSAATSAKISARHIARGFFRRPWFAAHHTMETAMIVLFALRHASSTIRAEFSAKQVWDMTKLFTANFLNIAAQGWTEVEGWAGIYERLLGPLLEHTFRAGDGNDHADTLPRHFGPQQDAELVRLLYPGPAQTAKLGLGGRPVEDPCADMPFDLDIFGVGDDFLNATLFGSMGESGTM